MGLAIGDLVKVKEEFDIPPMFRDYKPTIGAVTAVDGEDITIVVPIGKEDPDEHSQSTFHHSTELEKVTLRDWLIAIHGELASRDG